MRPLKKLFIAALFILAFPAAATAAITVTQGNGYEIWTISGMETYDLQDGEVLSNILVDQSAAGATLTIRAANKTGWEVRNIGFKGVGQDGDGGNSFQFQVSAPAGGTGLIENVWMNGKARDGLPGSKLGGIYIRASHAGHIDIRHTYIEGYGNNAVYGSAVGKDSGSEGTVLIENAYHRDNTVSQFRIGSPGSIVRNSVGIVDDPQGLRGFYPSFDSKNARGIWGKHFRNQRVENSSFYISPNDFDHDGAFEARYIDGRSRGPEAILEVVDCNINSDAPSISQSTSNATVNITNLGNNPTVTVIQDGGVPMSPEMAAEGGRAMPPELPGATPINPPAPSRTIRFDGTGSQRSEYAFTVDVTVQADNTMDSLEAEDSISGTSVDGVVDGDVDAFAFDDSITDFVLFGDALVYLDDAPVDPAALGSHYPNLLEIDGRNVDRTDYSFTVDGELVEYEYFGGMGTGDSITGSTATGFVNGGTDGYAFSGDIIDFQLTGNASVYLNGQLFDSSTCCGATDPAPDAGADAGTTDAGTADAGSGTDLGTSADAGTEDAREFPGQGEGGDNGKGYGKMDADGGFDLENDQTIAGEGVACSAAPARQSEDGPALILLVLGIALGLRRRRRS